jgi:predicted DNA-binding transcriptional regulator AlpA
MIDDEFLTVPEVSALTRIPVGTLYNYRSAGIGPPSFRRGNKLLYRRSSVLAWMAEQEAADTRYAPPGGLEPARRTARSVTKQSRRNRSDPAA